MPDVKSIEQQIRQLLAANSNALALSEQLFSPVGLFAQLAPTEAERRALVQSALFRDAQRQLLRLQEQEATAFSESVSTLPLPARGRASRVKLEWAEAPEAVVAPE